MTNEQNCQQNNGKTPQSMINATPLTKEQQQLQTKHGSGALSPFSLLEKPYNKYATDTRLLNNLNHITEQLNSIRSPLSGITEKLSELIYKPSTPLVSAPKTETQKIQTIAKSY